MGRYDYRCNACNSVREETHSIKDSPIFTCNECDSKKPLERLISYNAGGFICSNTEASNWKEKRMRMKKRSELGTKQIERYGTEGQMKLHPNVAGVETESWKDAAKLAGEAGINTETYKPMIEKEKHVSGGIDNRAWRAAKDEKNK